MGILGMLAGAALFAEVYPGLKKTVLMWGNLGKSPYRMFCISITG